MEDQERPNPRGPLNLEKLSAFEARIGVTLPAEYRHFLLANNGGGISPEEITLPGQSEPFTTISSGTFGMYGEDNELNRVYSNCAGVLPAELVAFAEDYGGNLFCISIKGPCRGSVYFWDHNQSCPGCDEPSWAGLTLLAGSFNTFVAHLGRAQPGE